MKKPYLINADSSNMTKLIVNSKLKKSSKKSSKKSLKNDKYETRNSPNVSAQEHKNKLMEGNDGLDYVSKPDKNGVYKWVKIKEMIRTKSVEEFFNQFPDEKIYYNVDEVKKTLRRMKNDLLKFDIVYVETGWKYVYNFIDNSLDVALDYIKKNYKYLLKKYRDINKYTPELFVPRIYISDFEFYISSINGNLDIYININDKNIFENVYKLFKSYFKNRVSIYKKKELSIKLNKL